MTLTHSFSPVKVDELVENIVQHDQLAAYEYLDHHRRKTHIEPEKNLMLALLEDAVRCYRAYAFSTSVSSQRLYRDAENWLWDNDGHWLFSFRNVCEGLGLEPYCVRKGLLRWKQTQTRTGPRVKPRASITRSRLT
jgi:hypothetical protein